VEITPIPTLTEEERILQLLVQYDVAGVDEQKLRQIFNCTAENLADARQQEYYLQARAEAQEIAMSRAVTIDTAWDSAEATSVKQLNDLMEFNSDPRLALLVASKANQATRRLANNPLAAMQKRANAPAVIHTEQLAGPTRTVRVRTKFADTLQEITGVRRLVEREVEITETDTGSLDEGMTPAKLKGLMTRALGVNMDDVAITRRSNSTSHGLDATLDFSQISFDEE